MNGYCQFLSRAISGYYGQFDGPTLIHDHFAVFAYHYGGDQDWTGRVITWLGTDGNTHTGTVSGKARIGETDICILYFATAIHSNVTRAKILPSAWTLHLTLPVAGVTIGADFTNTTLRSNVRNITGLGASVIAPNATAENRVAFTESTAVGLSGSPIYLVDSVNGEVLLTTYYTFSGGPSLAYYAADIEAAMTTLAGSPQTLTYAELSSYDFNGPAVTFVADPDHTRPGGPVTLSWTSVNSTAASLDNGIGTVPLSGSVGVHPEQSTTYTLTVQGPGGTQQLQTYVGVNPMANITAVFSNTAHNIVSINSTTKTWVVAGNMLTDAVPLAASNIIAYTPTAGGRTEYTLTTAAPTWDGTNTTFVTTTAPAGNPATGTVYRVLKWAETTSWVGGVAPVAGDVVRIPFGSIVGSASETAVSDCDISGELYVNTSNGCVTTQAGGYARLTSNKGVAIALPGSTMYVQGGICIARGGTQTTPASCGGLFICESGGEQVINPSSGIMICMAGGTQTIGIMAGGSAICRAGGTQTIGTNQGGYAYCETGGSQTITANGNPMFVGVAVCESGGNQTIATNYATPYVTTGLALAFASTNQTITSGRAAYITTGEVRSLHYTGDITAKITDSAGNVLNNSSTLASPSQVLAGVSNGGAVGTLDVSAENASTEIGVPGIGSTH